MSTAPQLPKLQPAGAGVPWLDRQLGKFALFLMPRVKPRDALLEHFASLARACEAAALSVTAEKACQQVLIERLAGLEDSSRYWSLFMTLDHLNRVNAGVCGLILALARGESPNLEVRTQDVKPSPEADATVIEVFRATNEAFMSQVKTLSPESLDSAVRHIHPWFGPLQAREWQALTVMHFALHLRQMGLIKTALA